MRSSRCAGRATTGPPTSTRRRGAAPRVVLFEQGGPDDRGIQLRRSKRSASAVSASASARSRGAFTASLRQSMAVIGVTGTNGKTTCTQLIAQAFELLGTRCGVIGTLGWGFPGRLDATLHTTPDAASLQQMLAAAAPRRGRRRGAGGVLARAEAGPRARGAFRDGDLHQPHPRSSRLPRQRSRTTARASSCCSPSSGCRTR